MLYYERINEDPLRITKIKPFIDKYNWKRINCPSEKDDWRKVEKNNLTIATNISYVTKEIYFADCSKYNSNCEKQIILLVTPNGKA